MRARLLLLSVLMISLVAGLIFPVMGAPAGPVGEEGWAPGETVGLPRGGAEGPAEGEQLGKPGPSGRSLMVEAFPLEDTWIYEWEPLTNFGASGGFRVRPYGGIASALLRWELSSIPVGAVVQNARLELYCTYRDRAAQIEISAYKVLVPWQENSATWNLASSGVPWTQAGCRAIGVDREGTAAAKTTIPATGAVPGWYAWTLTSLVQEWVNAPASNYGLILVGAGTTVSYDFFSSEGNPTFQPRLIVEYQPPAATATPTSAPPTLTATPSATATAGPSPTRTATPSALGTIQGMVFEDRNGNGVRDAGEPGLAGARLTLATLSGIVVGTRLTGADGLYAFGDLAPGTYRLTESNPPGTVSTTPDTVLLPVAGGSVVVFDFGDRFVGSVTPSSTPAGTATPTPRPSATNTPGGVATLTPTFSVTQTPSPTWTSPAATATGTATPTPSRTASITPTPSRTPTPGPSPTPTETPTSWIDVSRAMPAHCKGVFIGDTTGKPNNASRYGDLPWPETGPEDVYILIKTVTSDLTVSLVDPPGVDHDVFLLYEPHPSALLRAGEGGFFYPNLAPGTYYLVVDGYDGSMGPYQLSVFCEGEPTPTATPTNTPVHSYLSLLYKMPTPTPTRTATPTRTPLPTITPTPPPYQVGVNCGGTWYQASDGLWYRPDQQYTPGSWGWVGGQQGFVTTTDQPISNTVDDALYQSQRYAMSAYRFTVPAGRYEVLLRFAEIFPYAGPGRRIFSVDIEGQRVLDHVDTASRWGRYRAWDGLYCVEVGDGVLDITFESHTTEYAAVINAIRVTRVERCP